MSRITLFAFAGCAGSRIRLSLACGLGLAVVVAVAGLASAEWYEGKPECPPDHVCTMSSSEEGEREGENDASPECEECLTPPERGDGDGDPSDDCFETEEQGLVCYRNADDAVDDGPGFGDCEEDVCSYDGGLCRPPASSMDAPNATAEECASFSGPADGGTGPEPDDVAEVRRDAPAGALVGALAALAVVALVRGQRPR